MKQLDFITGNVRKILLAFFFPMLLANIMQQAYSFIDMIIISKCIGENAFAAVGNFSSFSFFIIGFATGITNGFSVNISQAYGVKKQKFLRKTIAAALKLSFIISIILTLIGIFFLKNILTLMHTDNLILNDSLCYGYIIFGGLSATIAYNLFSAVLRAFGDSKTPFIAICISAVLNIILDFISIYILQSGVSGPAFATIISQAVSAGICFIKLYKLYDVKLKASDFKTDNVINLNLLKNGLPMAFMNSVTSVGCIFVQGCINSYGIAYTSAYSACSRYINLFMLPGITIGFAITAFTGQNYGARNFSRIKEGVKAATVITSVSTLILSIILLTFPKQLAKLMLTGSEAVNLTVSFLKILVFLLILLNLLFVFRSCVQGLGKPLIPMLSGFAEMLLRMPIIFIGLKLSGFEMTAYAEGIAWIGALIMNITAYNIYTKKF